MLLLLPWSESELGKQQQLVVVMKPPRHPGPDSRLQSCSPHTAPPPLTAATTARPAAQLGRQRPQSPGSADTAGRRYSVTAAAACSLHCCSPTLHFWRAVPRSVLARGRAVTECARGGGPRRRLFSSHHQPAFHSAGDTGGRETAPPRPALTRHRNNVNKSRISPLS